MAEETRTDEALIHAAQAGDRAALEALLTRYHGKLFRFGQKMCSNPDTAQDVVQDAMLAVVRHIGDFRGASQFSTWLYTIARRACLRKFRKSKFAPEHEDSLESQHANDGALLDKTDGPEERAAVRELDDALSEAIHRLDPQSREVLVLRDVEGLSAAEVAEIVGANVPAVKSRLHRARVSVRNALAPMLEEGVTRAPETPACRDVVSLFSQYLEGEIDGEICRTMQSHVDSCARCKSQCDSLKRTLKLCSTQKTDVHPAQQLAIKRAIQDFLKELPAS
jgi:RNA polymerase sigma-70 factor (ECF subfamily)